MAENWKQLQREIADDLKNDGMKITITQEIRTEYSPTTGDYPATYPQDFTVYGLLKSFGTPGNTYTNYNASWLAGTTIEQEDKIVLCSCKDYAPQLGDIVHLSDADYRIKAISAVEPGDVALLRYLLIGK